MPKTHLSVRAAASLSALALAGAVLSACGGSSGASHSSSSARSTSASAPATHTSATAPAPATAPKRSTTVKPAPHRAMRITPAQSTAFRKAFVSFASCLRQNGVKMPAPNASGSGPVIGGRLNTNSPQYRAAVVKCRGVLVSAFRKAAKLAHATTPEAQSRTTPRAKG